MMPQSPESIKEELVEVETTTSDDAMLENSVDSDDETASFGLRHLRAWLYSLTALLVIFLGAGREVWSWSLAFILMGVTLCVAPPRFSLRPFPRYLLIWLALVPSVGLLPAKWFGPLEPWRTNLVHEWGIDLSSSYSPVFQISLETWLISLTGLLWLWSCLGQNFSQSGRRIALKVLAFGCIFIALLTELEFLRIFPIPWWPHLDGGKLDANFGPFANRNHASSLFALASVLCASACLDSVRRKSRFWLFFLLGIVLLFTCIVSNTSRAGLMLFLLGMSCWVGTVAMSKGVMRKIIVSCAIIGVLISVVLTSNSYLAQRLQSRSLGDAIVQDLRFTLAEETLIQVSSAPWLGRGRGIFEYAFPHAVRSKMPEARAIHPESDVLWMLFEGGLMLFIPCALLLFWVLSTTGPWFSQRKRKSHESRSDRRIRKSFAIAACIAVLHSVFDVPLHGFGYFLLIAFIASLAIRPRYSGSRISLSAKWCFQGVGVLMILAGSYILCMFFGLVEVRLPSMASSLHDRALSYSKTGKNAEALVLINRAIELSPLDFRLYFLRAEFYLILRQDKAQALLDFGRARAIEPRYASFCMEEGNFWMRFDPGAALIPWRECLHRYAVPDEQFLFKYYQMVGSFAPFPEHHLAVWGLANHLPMQLMCLIQYNSSPHWERIHAEFLTQHPGLKDLNENQVHYFFSGWQQKGDKKALLEYINKDPRLQKICWRMIAMDMAQSGQFEAAFKISALRIPAAAPTASISAADIPRLERIHLLNPVDILPGVELYYAQRASGDLKSARVTLEKVMKLPKAPSFLKRELASLLAETGDFRGAWDFMRQIIEATPVESSPLEKTASEDDGIKRPKAPEPRDRNSSLL